MRVAALLAADHAAQAVPWQKPELHGQSSHNGGGNRQAEAQTQPLTVDELEQIRAGAQQEGFEQGRAEGQAQVQQEVSRLQALMAAFAQPLKDLDDEVEAAIRQLATTLAVQLVRRELRQDPAAIQQLVSDVVDALPTTPRDLIVRVHPDLLEQVSLPEVAEQRWRLLADAALEPGDVQVQAQAMRVDGRIVTRCDSLARNLQQIDHDPDQ